MLLALLVGAWLAAGRASADDGPAAEEEATPAAVKQKERQDRQMKGLAVCVVAVFIITGVFWGLNRYNKERKRLVLLQRKQEREEAALREQVLQECDLPSQPAVPSEPPAGDW
jgi:hypothetical protein